MRELQVIGAGGHATVVIALLKALKYPVVSIIDTPRFAQEMIMEIPIVTKPLATAAVVIAMGDNQRRQAAFLKWQDQLLVDNLYHPKAYIDDTARLGVANQVFAFAMVGPAAALGNGNILNTQAVVEHQVELGHFNHIAPGAKLLGKVKVGDRCFIGANAVMRDGISICSDVIVGANSYVAADIKSPGVYVGTPARRIKA